MSDVENRITEVLAKHQFRYKILEAYTDEVRSEVCGCGEEPRIHALHQAALLAPLIADAQAVALEEAAKPFHHDSITAHSLRARAASLRGES